MTTAMRNCSTSDDDHRQYRLLDPDDSHSFESVGDILRGLWPSLMQSARSTE